MSPLKKSHIKAGSRWTLAAIIIAAALAGTFLCLIVYVSTRTYHGPKPTRIYIPAGSTEEAVCDSLQSRLGEEFGGRVFRMWSIFGDGVDRAIGSYVIEPGENVRSVVHRLNNGLQTPVRFTFNNVRRLSDLASKAAARMQFSADDFMAAADSILPLRGYASQAEYPAAFLPDTYEFYWTAPAADVVTRLADFRDAFWTDARRNAARELGLTPVQVATLASIVEEESNLDADRPVIARLYLNRLNIGMKLQADPTVKYALGDASLRRITGKHLSVDSPYNTYMHPGLPPGPIRIVEKKTLEQVLDAPQADYLYMCAAADFSGRHAFARDYATHQANARAYQKELNRRGIK